MLELHYRVERCDESSHFFPLGFSSHDKLCIYNSESLHYMHICWIPNSFIRLHRGILYPVFLLKKRKSLYLYISTMLTELLSSYSKQINTLVQFFFGGLGYQYMNLCKNSPNLSVRHRIEFPCYTSFVPECKVLCWSLWSISLSHFLSYLLLNYSLLFLFLSFFFILLKCEAFSSFSHFYLHSIEKIPTRGPRRAVALSFFSLFTFSSCLFVLTCFTTVANYSLTS